MLHDYGVRMQWSLDHWLEVSPWLNWTENRDSTVAA